MNIGEQLVADYLQWKLKCNFVQTNVYTTDSQGEIDVIGINTGGKVVYVCEVAIHLQGLQYTKDSKPNNTNKIVDKFKKIKTYTKSNFKGYEIYYMFWSPVVKVPKRHGSYNALDSVKKAQEILSKKHSIDLKLIVNDEFLKAVEILKDFASKETKELKSPVMRLFQIDSYINK